MTGLPRSSKRHFSNSLEFGPDGGLYLSQGSNSATGAPDATWDYRSETLLTGSILRIDPNLDPPKTGFNVQTEDFQSTEGNYNPFAPDAPVTIYGKGIRNAYDLVWHSNGNLYAPNNGSAAGGNTPDDLTLIGSQELLGVATQNDHLYLVEEDGYYGHPNPQQGHYILNGGNPTTAIDLAEVAEYPVGTKPDRNYQGFAFDFGRNRSPNGIIEYQGDAFEGALQNKLLVVEYSGGDDILALTPDASGNIIDSFRLASGFTNPIDLVEHPNTGNIYVAELGEGNFGEVGGGNGITLLSAI